jgi:hypothetical protein
MQHFRKYEFTPTQWATAKAKIETTTTNPEGESVTTWDASKVNAVVELGKLCTEWGTDEEGNRVCVKESSKVSVDILWADQPGTTSFSSYVVWPEPCGVHIFAGWEAQYAKDYCEANPSAAYCQPPAPIEP